METKTFGQLTVNDNFYVFSKSNGNYFNLIASNLKESEDKRNHIEIKDDDGEVTDLPTDQSRFEDENYVFTMDETEFYNWHIPKWEKEVKIKQEKINQFNLEIEELNNKIEQYTL